MGTGLNVMLVGHKGSGKSSVVKRLGIAVEMNGKSSHFIDADAFMGLCQANRAQLFCIPDLLVIENVDFMDDRSIRYGLCVGHERRKFHKDTILCINANSDLMALEILWRGHEYANKRCS